MNQVTVEGGLLPFNQSIMVIDSYSPMIVRDREGKDLPVELILTRHQSIQLDDSICRNGSAMSVPSIRDIECFVAAFYLRCQKREKHLVRRHQTRRRLPIINRRLQFLKLVGSECRRFEPYSKVGLRARTFDERDGFNSTLIDGYD